LTATWVPHDVRDQVVDFVRRWSEKSEISVGRFIHWLGVTVSKFYDWRQRYGRVNEHNGWVPRDFWLEPWEKEAIIGFHLENPLEGYRRRCCRFHASRWDPASTYLRFIPRRGHRHVAGGEASRQGSVAVAAQWLAEDGPLPKDRNRRFPGSGQSVGECFPNGHSRNLPVVLNARTLCCQAGLHPVIGRLCSEPDVARNSVES
jgi:hypothetical protein